MISDEVKDYIDKSVLCWLATSNDNKPSVSPKQIFTYFNDTTIIIAHIHSPQSVKNIKSNPNVCVSFVDIFTQRGFQCYGIATIISQDCEEKNMLQKILGDSLKVISVISIKINKINKILAPSYRGNKMTETEMIEDALKTYGFENKK